MRFNLSQSMNPLSDSFQRISRHFCSSLMVSRNSPNDISLLYRRISPLGNPNDSVVPVLDQWVQEGRHVGETQLRQIITELKVYGKFKQSLEVSLWMSDKRYIPLTSPDVATRMNLMYKVHGLNAVENYFRSVHGRVKNYMVYIAMLNCYAKDKCVEKAEAIKSEIMEKGFVRTALPFNIMIHLYYATGNWKKIDGLMNEMEEKGIYHDKFTLILFLRRYADVSDLEGIDRTVATMEENPQIALDFDCYSAAARAYLNVGQINKALMMLEKLERVIPTAKRRNTALSVLLQLYAKTGKKDEVQRIWAIYKKKVTVNNKGYISVMRSLLKFNDVDGIEKIFAEWESSGLSYDFRVLNLLISAYSSEGELEKAEALIKKGISEGGEPNMVTWYRIAKGYMKKFQIPKAIEALKKAIPLCPSDFRPSEETMELCVRYLERREDVEKAEEFLERIKAENIFPGVDHDRLLQFIKYGE